MNSGKADLFLCWDIILEGRKVNAVYVDFESYDEESGGYGGEPLE